MSKKHQTGSQALQVAGGGPVKLQVFQTGPNQFSCQIAVDYQHAAIPERSYYADYCDVQRARAGFGLFFGKLITGSSRLRTKIEIDFPEEMFVKQLWNTSREFHRTVQIAAETMHFPPLNEVEDTDKVQTFRSNNVCMVVMGEEAVMDFYYLSPRDVQMQQRGSPGLEPVIRVVMPTPLILEFLEKCRQYVEIRPEIEISDSEVI
jgi:hypothetical protein